MGLAAHRTGGSGQLLEGFPLGGEGRHEGADLGVGDAAREDVADQFAHLLLVQVLAPDDPAEVLLEHGGPPVVRFRVPRPGAGLP